MKINENSIISLFNDFKNEPFKMFELIIKSCVIQTSYIIYFKKLDIKDNEKELTKWAPNYILNNLPFIIFLFYNLYLFYLLINQSIQS